MFFVRLYGDEGFCQFERTLSGISTDNQFTFRLLDLGSQCGILPTMCETPDFRAEHSAGNPPKVQFVKGQGVFVTFDMPENPVHPN